MNLKALKDTPPWDWPKGASKTFLDILQDDQAVGSDRLLAAELAGDFTVINDELVDALLLLAAIDAAASIRPQEAPEILNDLTDSDDADIVEVVYEAMAMAESLSDKDDEDDKGEEDGLRH